MILERNDEQKILKRVKNSDKAEFLAVYGRCRVGKTYLISNFFNTPDVVYLEFMGRKSESEEDLRDIFIEEIASVLNEDVYDYKTNNWKQVFRLLKKELNKKILENSFFNSLTIGKTSTEIYNENKEITTPRVINRILQNLVDCGFIKKQCPFKFKKKQKEDGIQYYLVDNYSIFYIHWISGKVNPENSSYWANQIGSPIWNSWKGITFESICLDHVDKIKEELGISSVETYSSGWRGGNK